MEPEDTKLTNETFSAVNEENQEAEKQVTGTAESASQKTKKRVNNYADTQALITRLKSTSRW